jgi:hypothetical protein
VLGAPLLDGAELQDFVCVLGAPLLDGAELQDFVCVLGAPLLDGAGLQDCLCTRQNWFDALLALALWEILTEEEEQVEHRAWLS